MKKTITVITVLALIFVLCSCGKAQPQIAKVCFDSNPTTGYTWNAFQSEELFEISSEFVEDSKAQEGMTGVGGKEYFTLKPIKAGSCEVSFVYQRPWEAMELGDTYTYQITVSENMQITVKGGTAQLNGDSDILPVVPELEITNAG